MNHPEAKGGFRRLLVLGACVTLPVLCDVRTAAAAEPLTCDVALTVQLTPDVPNPSDAGFLSSLLSNHPEYRLIFQGRSAGDELRIELRGPGPDYLCRNVIQTIGRDGRVLSVHAVA